MKPTRTLGTCLAAVLVLLLTALSLTAAQASPSAVRVTPAAVVQDSLTAPATGRAVLKVHAADCMKVAYIGVSVRTSAGAWADYPGSVRMSGANLCAQGMTYVSDPAAYPPGTYTLWGFVRTVDGAWHATGPVQTLTVPGNPAPAGPLGIPGTWHSAFDDEFNGTSVGAAWQKGWLSNSEFTGPVNTLEDQGYDSANVTESGGSLHLAMRGGHGALVNTDGHLNFIYGAVEARIYLPGSGATVSNWPAFWLDGQTWPQDGENDIMEGLSGGTSCHFHSSSTDADGGCLNVGPGWHVFATDWEPGIVTWYYDGHKVGSLSSGTTGAPQYVIINNTSGATIGGPRDMSADMLVDYVRTWSH